MKKVVKFIAALVIPITFIGCGTLKTGINTVINKDGSGEVKIVLKAGGLFGQAITEENDFIKKDSMKDVKIESKVEDDGKTKIITATKNFKSIKELNEGFKGDEKSIVIKVDEKDGIIKNKYKYEVILPNDFNKESIMKEAKEKGNVKKESNDSKQPVPEIPGLNEQDIVNFISSAITLESSVKVPGNITKTTGNINSDNNIKWSYSLGDINKDTKLFVEYEVNNTGVIVGISVGLVAVLGIITFIIIKQKRKREEEW